MTALQTERFYPQLTTGRPWVDTLTRHAWTGLLAASATTCALTAALTAIGAATALASNQPINLIWAAAFSAATYRLARWTWLLARTIRSRA